MNIVVMPQTFTRQPPIYVNVAAKDVQDVCDVVLIKVEHLKRDTIDRMVNEEIARRLKKNGWFSRWFRGSLDPKVVRRQISIDTIYAATVEFRIVKQAIHSCMNHSQGIGNGQWAVQQKDWALVLRAYWKYCA